MKKYKIIRRINDISGIIHYEVWKFFLFPYGWRPFGIIFSGGFNPYFFRTKEKAEEFIKWDKVSIKIPLEDNQYLNINHIERIVPNNEDLDEEQKNVGEYWI